MSEFACAHAANSETLSQLSDASVNGIQALDAKLNQVTQQLAMLAANANQPSSEGGCFQATNTMYGNNQQPNQMPPMQLLFFGQL